MDNFIDRIFDSVVKSFLTPINFLLYFVIFLYFIGYITGAADLSGVIIFSIVCVGGNLISGIIGGIVDSCNAKKFETLYIYGGYDRKKRRR